jgi:hypothetical protein
MSGTFMDGGGHDHGGHQSGHGSGGDGGGYMDGGHDHGGHGHQMHGSGGDGGGFLNHLLGYNNHTAGHSFLSHLLGLDHDAHHGHGGADGGTHGGEGAVSQTPIWTSALQGLKLSHALEGISISVNAWFFMFFMGCIAWLFVVYWIRHHEPFADAVLGKGAAKYQTAAADRMIIDKCRDATPLRTSTNQGMFAPMPQQFHDPAAANAIALAAAAQQSAAVNQLAPSTSSWVPPGMLPQSGTATTGSVSAPIPVPTGDMASYYSQSSPYGSPVALQGTGMAAPGIPNPSGPGQLIATPMPMALPGAQRLKMIINR